MKERHSSRPNLAAEAIAHNEISTSVQWLKKMIEMSDVVAIIAVSHEDVIRASGANTCAQSAPVASFRYFDDASPFA
ncbi:MAG TPA: hypothetical protein VFU50_15430 [Terriglobales bacterium]|nr:hypothetical protein [Terriglobales bacterium]